MQGIHVPDVWEQLLEDCHKHLRLPAAQQAEARQAAHHILAKQHNPPLEARNYLQALFRTMYRICAKLISLVKLCLA